MNEIILFQNKEEAKFKAERIRKNIKAALVENEIKFNPNYKTPDEIAHLIWPFPLGLVKELKEDGKKVVLSLFYTKDARHGKRILSLEAFFKEELSKALVDIFDRADKILVPIEEYKKALVSKGLEGEKIEVVTSGINLQIYKFLPETDMGLARRYFSLGVETKILLAFADYEDKECLDRLNAVALLRPDSKVICIGTGKYSNPLFKRFSKKYKKPAPNIVFSKFVDINIYRSLLKNARCVLFLNSYFIDDVQILETMAAETQAIAYDLALPNIYRQPFIMHTDDIGDLYKMISNFLDYKISNTVSDAYYFVSKCDVKQLGENLKMIYNNLL
ncbi:MAG: hypothetical protein RSD40_00930 [Bacilli bacterium]